MANSTAGRAVVMEDNQSQRDAMVRTLQAMGYDARGSKSAMDVLQQVNDRRVDLCILDIHMGDGQEHEGLRVLEKAIRVRENCLIGVITAWDEKLRLAENVGGDGFVKKTTDIRWDTCNLVNAMLRSEIKKVTGENEAMIQSARERRSGWWWGRGAASFGFLNVVVSLVCVVLLMVIAAKTLMGSGSEVPTELLFSFSTALGWIGNAYLSYRATDRIGQ